MFWQPAGPELQLSVSRQGLYRTDVLDAAITGQTNNYLPGQAFPQADGSVFASVKLEWKW